MKTENPNKVNEILDSLDGMKRVAPPSFFYTRLKARMEKGFEPSVKRPWVLRPVFALAALVLVILINAAIILGPETEAENNGAEVETYQSIAAEYNLNDSITEEVYK